MSYISIDMQKAITEPAMFTPEVLREIFPQGIMPTETASSLAVRSAMVLAILNTILVAASFIALVVK